MRPAVRIIPEFSAEEPDKWRALVDDLHVWALGTADSVAQTYKDWNTLHTAEAPDLNNRSWEVSAPLIVLTDFIWGRDEAKDRITWLTTYFAEQRKSSDNTDIIRLLATTLPEYLRTSVAHEEWYYPVRSILDNLRTFMDEDASERLTTRSMVRFLTPLGFTQTKQIKGGKMIQITEADLRRVFKERRIEPMPENLPWLEGEVDYQTEARIAQTDKQEVLTWDGNDEG